MEIEKIIQQKLWEIEKQEQVTILHAVESGSRAWGFASPDSDYDVRFIYVRRKSDYLKLQPFRDVIEWQLDDTLDINGWDLKKTLQLLYKSNPTLFEWNNSPIVYQTTDYWNVVRPVIESYFSSKSGLYHYLNTANRNYHEFLLEDMVKLKKYFYVLRPILACKWILQQHCPPPMLFTELAEAVLEPEIRPEVEKLLKQKMETTELGVGQKIQVLNDYIAQNLVMLKDIVDHMEQEQNAGWEQLNALFLQGIEYR